MSISTLQKVINYLTENRKIFINICDLTGLLNNIPELYIPLKFQINSTSFCDAAKSNQKGLIRCINCKTESVNRCCKTTQPYKRNCYLGITQYICPVQWDKKTVCIIYVSNIIENTIDECKKIYTENERKTGIPAMLLENTLETCEINQNSNKYQIATEIIRDVIISVLEKENVKIGAKNNVISGIINYCNEFYRSDLTLEYFAKQYYMNSDYLCRLFKKETGQTFTSYLNGIRINKAKQLLAETDKKITEIAFEIGYTNDTYFIKKFKEYCRITPKQYQISIRR